MGSVRTSPEDYQLALNSYLCIDKKKMITTKNICAGVTFSLDYNEVDHSMNMEERKFIVT